MPPPRRDPGFEVVLPVVLLGSPLGFGFFWLSAAGGLPDKDGRSAVAIATTILPRPSREVRRSITADVALQAERKILLLGVCVSCVCHMMIHRKVLLSAGLERFLTGKRLP